MRIRKGYAIPDLDGALVEKWEQWYVERPDYVARMIERSRRYLYYIVAEVEKRGHADRNRTAADDRERIQPDGLFAESRLGHLAIHAVDRKPLRLEAELLVRFAARRGRRDRQARSTTCKSSTASSATGSWRWRPTTGAKATSPARLRCQPKAG